MMEESGMGLGYRLRYYDNTKEKEQLTEIAAAAAVAGPAFLDTIQLYHIALH